MNITPVSSLLGVAVFGLCVAALQEPAVSVWPPGSEIYLGESVLMHCRMESNSTFAWTYHWYKYESLTQIRGPLVGGDSFLIAAVRRTAAGSYWCKAEQRGSNSTTEVEVELSVTEPPPPSLTVTPSSRQFFTGERFAVRCPTGWNLTRLSLGHSDRIPVKRTQTCSPQGGAVGADKTDKCVFTADRGNSGLYWCESSLGRSRAVSLTVSDGNVLLKTPVLPVHQGDTVVLNCLHRTGNHSKTSFYKNGTEIKTSDSSNLMIENVTQEDEGFYKCVMEKTESPESWLSVTLDGGNFTSNDTTAASESDSWKWITVSCVVVLLFLTPVTAWLVQRNRRWTFHTQSCWLLSKEDVPAAQLPATKQDVTEVQWDLSWMEMSSLLDKQLYPGT